MKVVKVTPRGYCLGVVKSIKWAKEAAVKYAGRPNLYVRLSCP
ncbi:hypothetical protein [Spiroplasma sp. ald]